MARNIIVPLSDLNRRPPEAGRIRMGVKSGKGMKSIDTFRFTSPQRSLVEQLAVLYGGEVKPWSDPKSNNRNQFEIITKASEIRVYLVPEGLSIWYEEWSGGGNTRRCDGELCEISRPTGNDDYELVKVPCLCRAQNLRVCRPYTRLQVIIPDISFAGVWRLETKGWNAAAELPGMYEMVLALSQQGQMVTAKLGIDKREDMANGRKRHFVVPRISIEQSVLQIQSGAANAIGAISAGEPVATPALAAAPADVAVPPSDRFDDDIADAEIIDDDELEAVERLKADARNFALDPERYVAGIRAAIAATPKDATLVERLRGASDSVRAGIIVPVGFQPDGRVQWAQP